MKLNRVVANSNAKLEAALPPSAVHFALAEVLGELTALAGKTGHPAAKIMRGIVPSLLPDMAEIPAELLSDFCRRMGSMLMRVADAETVAPPPIAAFFTDDDDDLSRSALTQGD